PRRNCRPGEALHRRRPEPPGVPRPRTRPEALRRAVRARPRAAHQGARLAMDAGAVPTGAVPIGYAAMLAQFPPAEAVALAEYAEQRGFSGVMATDHFQPWVPSQGQSAFVWNVLTAIAERTTGDIGPGVTTPTFRWHPAMVAQASASLAAMYPGRHWLGIGSGEALNEHIVGQYWPEAHERISRMFEAIEIIKKLFS